MTIRDLTGRTLGGYDLRELLGVGGMGAVYRAYQAALGRAVAVKIMTPELARDATFLARFNREAHTAAALEHAHIVPVYDYGTEGDITYVVMRLLTGGTLTQRLTEHGEELPSLGDVARLLGQLGSALDYAHSQGVVHRDIKPSNVMFDAQGSAYLVDFGIAKLLDASRLLTTSGVVLGTPLFMPPEQWRAEAVTSAADQYALAVVAYLLVTGRVPFNADTPHGLMYQHLSETPAPPQSYRPDVPGDVALVLTRAMAKTPADRFPTVTGFVQSFEQAIPARMAEQTNYFTAPLRLTRRAGLPLAEESAPGSEPRSGTVSRRWVRRWSALGAVAVILAAVVVAGLLLRGGDESQPGVPPSQSPTVEQMAQAPLAPTDNPTPHATAAPTDAPTPSTALAAMPSDTPTLPASPTFESPPRIDANNAAQVIQVARLQQESVHTGGAVWSPDGTTLAVLGGGVQFYASGDWLAAPRRIDTTLGGDALAWSPDGTRLAVGTVDGSVVLLDSAAGTITATLAGGTGPVAALAWSPDGALLASAGRSGDRAIRVWDATTGQQTRLLEGHTAAVRGLAWSPDGSRLLAGGGDLRAWDVASGQAVLVMDDLAYGPDAVDWSPDGSRLASGSYEGVLVWDAATGRKLYTLPAGGDSIMAIAFSPDGSLLAYGGQDNIVHLVEVTTGRELAPLIDHTGWIAWLAWSPDGSQLASTSEDSTVRIWAVPGSDRLAPTALPPLPSTATAGEAKVVPGLDAIRPGNARDLVEVARLERDWTWIEALAWSPEASLLAVAANGPQVWLYAADDLAAEPRAVAHSYWSGVNALDWSPDGGLLAFGDAENAIRLLGMPGGVEWPALEGHADVVEDVAFSPDGSLLASAGGSRDRTVRVWDVASGAEVRLLEGHRGGVAGLAWSPDGTQIVSGGGGELRIWDVASGDTRLVMSDFYYDPACVDWSPDGAHVAFGSYEGVFVWDAASGQKQYALTSDGKAVEALAFSPDGALLAYGGQDSAVHVLDAESGAELVTLAKHTDWIKALRWSPDGRYLASASRDGTLRVWGLEP